jgi:DNA-binding SARP family transcriptional activator
MPGPTTPADAARFEIHLLGSFRLVYRSRDLPPFPTRASKLLFSFLALHRTRRHSRDALAALCWGDCPDREARRKLRTELWRLKQTLAAATDHDDYIRVSQNWVGFDVSRPHWLDVEAFERCVRGVDGLDRDDPGVPALLEAASALYAGEFLEGEYASWCLIEQDRLRALRLDVLERLFETHIRGEQWDRALRHGRELLRHDPLLEHVHRRVMALHYLAGDRPRALRQFERCRAILQEELSVEPMHRTRELYEALLAEDTGRLLRSLDPLPPARPPAGPTANDLGGPSSADAGARAAGESADDSLTELEQAAEQLVSAQTDLLKGIRALTHRSRRRRRSRDPSPQSRAPET